MDLPVDQQPRARPQPLSRLALGTFVPLLILLHSAASTGAAEWSQGETTGALGTGQVVEATFSGKNPRSYEVHLDENDFLKIVVEQLGVDVGLSLLSPGGAVLVEVDSPTGAFDTEELVWIASEPGSHRLVVTPFDEGEPKAGVEILLVEKRTSRESDRKAVDAQGLFSEGYKLLQDEKTASQRRGVDLARRAAAAWAEAGNGYERALALAAAASSLHNYLNESEEALTAAAEAQAIFHDMGRTRLERETMMARGIAEYRLERMPEALRSFARALALADASGDANARAQILSNQAMVYDSLGEKARAIAAYLDALAILTGGRNREVELYTLNNLAVVYEDQGDRQKALGAYRRALQLARELKARKSEAVVLANTGRVYERLGDTDRALDNIRQSVAISRELDDRHSEGLVQLHLGHILAARGDSRGAFEAFEAAHGLFVETKDERSQALTHAAESEVHLQAGESLVSRRLAEQALAESRRLRDPFIEAMTLTCLGNALAALGENGPALERLREAETLREKLGDRLGLSRTSLAIARVARAEGDLGAALAGARRALDFAESLRTDVVSADLRASFFATIQDAYAFTLDVLAALHGKRPDVGYDRQALEVAERARARSLLDLLAEARVEVREGVDPDLLDRERSLRRLVGAKLDAQMRLLSSAPTEVQAAAASREIDSLRSKLREAEEAIRQKSPRWAELRMPEPLGSAAIQRAVGDDTTLLEFASGETQMRVWAVTADSIRMIELGPRAEIEHLARRFHDALTARNRRLRFESDSERATRIRRADAESRDLGARLGRLLVGPAGVPEGRRIAVVAEGALQYVPFAALADGPGPAPLVAGHEIVSLPSASVLAAIRSDRAGRPLAPHALAVLADPVFDRNDVRVRRSRAAGAAPASPPGDLLRSLADTGDDAGAGIVRLPNTRREAQAILALVPAAERRAALDFDASRATATSPSLSEYRIIHFATHSLLNAAHPDLSGVVLSLVDRDGRPQPGFLSTVDVFNLRLPSELVVLSGCRTALGKDVRGEGLVGLSRAFLHAGAARILSSLWKVDDAATADLMIAAYREMLGRRAATPAAALRRAQISLARGARSAPYYWAGFLLQGEWR